MKEDYERLQTLIQLGAALPSTNARLCMMGMTMPIKANAEIEAMAGQLAALRGQSVEEVVAAALRAELAREPNARRPLRPAKLVPAQRGKVARILEMVRSAGPTNDEGEDRTAFLYDDYGLPR